MTTASRSRAARINPSVLIDGAEPSAEDLTHQALVNYGAYTSFRVEGGAVRGLDRHLARLRASSEVLFDGAPDEVRLRGLMRIAIAGREACWLRVSLFSPEVTARKPSWHGVPKVMTMTAPPPPPLADSIRLQLQHHEREQPALKHSAILGLIHARRMAREAGFDDALFANAAGRISEGSSWNVGFLQGETVVWPQAPMLAGVTQALIEEGLDAVDLRSVSRPVSITDLGDFDGAFICNSATPACAVTAIGNCTLKTDPAMIGRLARAWNWAVPETI